MRITNVAIDNMCTFSYTRTEREIASGYTFTDSYSLPLGAVTVLGAATDQVIAGSEKEGNRGVNIVTGNVAAIQHIASKDMVAGSTTDYSNSTFFTVAITPAVTPGADLPQPPDQMLPRIITALQHAVALCAGSYRPPAQSSQPF